MDANQPNHYRIEVYGPGESPPAKPRPVSLCPGARHLRVQLVQDPSLVNCRRCGELLDVIGLRPTSRRPPA